MYTNSEDLRSTQHMNNNKSPLMSSECSLGEIVSEEVISNDRNQL